MPTILRSHALLVLIWSVTILGVACSRDGAGPKANSGQTVSQTTTTIVAQPVASPNAATPTSPDPFHTAINRASSAFNMGQSAQSQDDWNLVASRWKQAIALLETVPQSSPNYAAAQTKLRDYRRNLDYAEQQASRSIPALSDGVIRIPPGSSLLRPQVLPPEVTSGDGGFQVPIIGRAGGTPVINVVFNGSQTFPMIVDTGASGTLITPDMASALNLVPVGQITSATASGSAIFPVGYVRSVEVGGAVIRNVPVAVGNSSLDIGLLGHDFFGSFDVTFRENVVEFRPR